MDTKAIRVIHKIGTVYGRQWGGYLLPTEILILNEIGAVWSDSSEYKIQMCKEEKAKGICNPTWIYFDIKRNSPLENYIEEHSLWKQLLPYERKRKSK